MIGRPISRRRLILHAATASAALALRPHGAAAEASATAPEARPGDSGDSAAEGDELTAARPHRFVSGLVRPGLDPFDGCTGRDPW